MEPRVLCAAGSVSGYVFNDTNADGQRWMNEPGLSGWRAYVDANNNGGFDYGEKSALASWTGAFTITGVNPGTYRLRVVEQFNWRRTTPAVASSYLVTVQSGFGVSGFDFGYTRKAVVAGRVFNDLNRNYRKDANEQGLWGWQVYVDRNRNGVFDRGEPIDSTDFYGNYRFVLDSGSYQIRVVPQKGWDRTLFATYTFYVPPAVIYYPFDLPQRRTA
jgi:hypothetical protein